MTLINNVPVVSNTKYITTEEILATVKSKLRSFEESGLLDESEMISDIFYVLELTKSSLEENKKLVLDVYDYSVDIPKDFEVLKSLELCQKCGGGKTKRRWYFGLPHTFTVRDLSKRFCYHKCDIHEEFNEITRTIYLDTEEETDSFCDRSLLEFRGNIASTDKILKSCPNLLCSSDNYFSVKDNKFFFNFEEGYVYMSYTGKKLDEDGYPLIEDNPKIIQAVIDYLIYKGLEIIYYNSEADVIQRLQYAQGTSARSIADAITYKKTPSHKSLMDYAKAVRKSSNRLNF